MMRPSVKALSKGQDIGKGAETPTKSKQNLRLCRGVVNYGHGGGKQATFNGLLLVKRSRGEFCAKVCPCVWVATDFSGSKSGTGTVPTAGDRYLPKVYRKQERWFLFDFLAESLSSLELYYF